MQIKKFIMMFAFATTIALAFAGCAQTANNLENQIPEVPKITETATAPLEAPIKNEPQTTQSSPIQSTTKKTDPIPTVSATPIPSPTLTPTETVPTVTVQPVIPSESPTEPSQSASSPSYSRTLADLANKVQDLAQKMDTATINDYKALKKAAKQLETQIDRLENQIKLSYYNQAVTLDEYNRYEIELDIMDDYLDDSEDIMEERLGIAD